MQINLEEVLKKFLFVLLAMTTLFAFEANSQKRKQIEYSGFFDSYYYRGPLNIHAGFVTGALTNSLQINSPRFNLGGSYKVWPRTYFGVDLNYIKINYATDMPVPTGSSGGIMYIYDMTAFCRFHLVDKRILFKNDIGKRPQRIRPYLMLGIGVVYYDAATSLQNLVKGSFAESSGIALNIPATLGFAIYLSKRFSLLAEGGFHYVLPNFSQTAVNVPTGTNSYLTAALKLQYSFVPFKRKKQKYKGPPLAPAGSGPGNQAPIKKDSTLNDPILPPGSPEPEKKEDLNAPILAPSGQGEVAPEAPKELTEEEKKKKQEEEEQKQWENSYKEDKAKPADKKKKAEPKKEEPSGW